MKLATFNANSVRTRINIVTDWLKEHQPDVLCLQETKSQDKDFPADAFVEAGYNVIFHGQKSYNGVAIASKIEAQNVQKGLQDGEEDPEQARFIKADFHGVTVINSYVPQGFDPESEKFQYKLQWYRRLLKHLEKNHSNKDMLIWTGDLNVAREEIDVYNHKRLLGRCCHHPNEFVEFDKVKAWGLIDVFRKHCPEPELYTFYDYRQNALANGRGWRIDHILATEPLAAKSTISYIDLEPRKKEKPSDHTFLVAEFDI